MSDDQESPSVEGLIRLSDRTELRYFDDSEIRKLRVSEDSCEIQIAMYDEAVVRIVCREVVGIRSMWPGYIQAVRASFVADAGTAMADLFRDGYERELVLAERDSVIYTVLELVSVDDDDLRSLVVVAEEVWVSPRGLRRGIFPPDDADEA